jgi:hypothetical protein
VRTVFCLLGSALLYSVVVNEVMVLSFLGIQNDVFWVADGDKSIFEAACSHNSRKVSAFYKLLC